MKVSINWIRDYVDLPADLSMEQLAYDLTMRTVEVEAVENPKDMLAGIVVGIIDSVTAHPSADLLRVCQVDVGREDRLQIVCGGSNLAVGQKVAVSVPGAMVRWHGQGEPVEIKVTELRGVKSEGMICGASELDLEQLFPVEDERVIMDLSGFEAAAGDPLGTVLELDDAVLEIDNKSMTNRPDLWGHYGIARELAAIYQRELKALPNFEPAASLDTYPVSIQTDQCMRYVAAVFDNLEVKPAPYWLQKRLWSVGIRPINNLVDSTNYVMLATGQPTHGFDFTHVPNGIVVRQAKAQEELELLDEHILKLSESDMVITNGPEPLALAGIMGGKKDSILPETQSMILEVASFNAKSVRRATQQHNVRTESSTRFEKDIDTARVEQALGCVIQLLEMIEPDARLVAYGEEKAADTQPIHVELDLDFLTSRMGRATKVDEVRKLLGPLGFKVNSENGSRLQVEVPVWRSTGDVSQADDILEEVARMIGYENFEFIPPKVELTDYVHNIEAGAERRIRELLAARAGFQEIFTYPWVKDDIIEASGLDTSGWLELEVPPAPDERLLRGSLVPNLIGSIVANLRYQSHFRIFELAQVFREGQTTPSEPSEVLPHQERRLCAALVGRDSIQLFREAKGVIEALPRQATLAPLFFEQRDKPEWADPKMWLNVLNDSGDPIGSVALLSLRTEHLAGIKHQLAVVFEVNVDALRPLKTRENAYRRLPLYPEVWQDLNVVVAEDVPWAAIEAQLKPLVKRSRFIEEYRGAQLPDGTKSILFRYWIGSDEGTMTAKEAETAQQSILHVLGESCGAEIRV